MVYTWVCKLSGRKKPLHDSLYSVLAEVDDELCVMVPYLREETVREMVLELARVAERRRSPVSVRVLSASDVSGYVLGEGELEAIQFLLSPECRRLGVDAVVGVIGGLHAKVYLSPKRSALVASANLTERGMKKNYEAGIHTNDRDILDQAMDSFEKLWQKARVLDSASIEAAMRKVQQWRSDYLKLLEAMGALERKGLFAQAHEGIFSDSACLEPLASTKASNPATWDPKVGSLKLSRYRYDLAEYVREVLRMDKIMPLERIFVGSDIHLLLLLSRKRGETRRLEIHWQGARGLDFLWEREFVEASTIKELQLALFERHLIINDLAHGKIEAWDLYTKEKLQIPEALLAFKVSVEWLPTGELCVSSSSGTRTYPGWGLLHL